MASIDIQSEGHVSHDSAPRAPRFGHVVIVGGSLAGLLAARVLSRYAARVSVIERDRPDALLVGARKGVPQGQHAHLLLRPGLTSLQMFFPGIERELEGIAGPAFDMVNEIVWKIDGQFRPRFASDYRAYGLGRPALEAVVRARVEALSNVTFLYGESATGLCFAGDLVSGVRIGERVLAADLVVDASGRGTRVPSWLEALGYPRIEQESVDLDLTYTSCVFAPREPWRRDFRVLLVPPVHPRCPRGGLLLPLEGGRYVATLIAYGCEKPPRDLSGFRAWAARVDDPLYAEVLAQCEPIGEPVTYAIPRQTWRHFERAQELPKGLLVIGDAMCSFDPGFGQGISVSALEAAALDAILHDPGIPFDALTQRYFARAAALIGTPWSLARARPVSASGQTRTSLAQRWLSGYRRELLSAAAQSPALHRAFVRVVNLEAGAQSFLAPGILLRVLAHRVQRARTFQLASFLERAPSPRTTLDERV